MSYPFLPRAPSATLELHFLNGQLPFLDRAVVLGENSKPVQVAVDLTTNSASDAYLQLPNSQANLALGQLVARAMLLRDSLDELPAISGRFASALLREIENDESVIVKLLTSGGCELISDAIRKVRFDDFTLAVLDGVFIASTQLVIVVDGHVLRGYRELREFEEAVEKSGQDFKRSLPTERGLRPRTNFDEVKHVSSGVSPKLIELFSSRFPAPELAEECSAIRKQLDELSTKELCYNLVQRVEIELFSDSNDWQTTFSFELLNVAFVPITTRSHQFWVQTPQENVEFDVRGAEGEKLSYSLLKESESYRELLIQLPEPIVAMGRYRYTISFRTVGDDSPNYFYSMSPRTLTKKLSFEVKGYPGFSFGEARVEVEDGSGHIKDMPPELATTVNDGLQTISWSQDNPRPGELYRTFWCDASFVPIKKRLWHQRKERLACVRGGSLVKRT